MYSYPNSNPFFDYPVTKRQLEDLIKLERIVCLGYNYFDRSGNLIATERPGVCPSISMTDHFYRWIIKRFDIQSIAFSFRDHKILVIDPNQSDIFSWIDGSFANMLEAYIAYEKYEYGWQVEYD